MTIIATLLSAITWTHLVGTPAEGPVRAESECAEAGQDLEGASWSEALGGLPAELTGDARLVSVVAYGTGEHLNARTSELWTLLEARTSGPLTRAMGLPDHLVADGPDRVAVYLEEKYSSPSRTIALYQAGENEPLTVQVWYASGGEAKRCGKYVVRLRATPTPLEFDSELENPRKKHLKIVDFKEAPPRATIRPGAATRTPPVGSGFLLTNQWSLDNIFAAVNIGLSYHAQASRVGGDIGAVGRIGVLSGGGGIRFGVLFQTGGSLDCVGLELMGLYLRGWPNYDSQEYIAFGLSISLLKYYWRVMSDRMIVRGGVVIGAGYLRMRDPDPQGKEKEVTHLGFGRIGYVIHFGTL
ncbi:MAG: hypothetical protein KC636_23980 [Myxococcales bacterium]|nr:hypothetical protein [Myxococcales bacterium]